MRSQQTSAVRHADGARAAEAIMTDGSARLAMHRRVLIIVIAGQVLGGAGLAAGVTVGALLAQQMLVRNCFRICRGTGQASKAVSRNAITNDALLSAMRAA